MNDISVQEVSRTVRSYEFDQPIAKPKFDWLKGNRNIQSYDVQGNTLTITLKDSTMSWDSLEKEFLVPGFTKQFNGEVNLKQYSHR